MTLTELAAITRPSLNDRVILAYAKLDEATDLLDGPVPSDEGQRIIRARILDAVASAQSDLGRLERMSRGDRS